MYTEARKKLLHGIFTTALEGGIGYWSECDKYHWSLDNGKTSDSEDLDGFFATVTPEEEETELRIDADVIEKGLLLLSDPNNIDKLRVNKNIFKICAIANARDEDDGDIDAEVADCIVQVGLFGEVIYG
jgi:hypothetical protein